MSMLEDGTIKFNCDMCFTNYVECPSTGERMSMVPDSDTYSTWVGPKFIKFFQDRARKTMNGLYGKEAESVPIESYRICWDASTPTHDFLITPHPHSNGLFVATGGSFHGWKFLPVIGDYIADMMDGTLAQDYASRWAWDKVGGDGRSANPTYQIIGDFQEWSK
jgi:sarcosine oxidase/L-pipecolate oxidase